MNLKEQGRLLRQNEFLVSEGRGAKKSLRQVFLFEELILFSKARRFPDRKVNRIFNLKKSYYNYVFFIVAESRFVYIQEQHQNDGYRVNSENR